MILVRSDAQHTPYLDQTISDMIMERALPQDRRQLGYHLHSLASHLEATVPDRIRRREPGLITTDPIYIERWVNSTLTNGNGPSYSTKTKRIYWAKQIFKHLSDAMGSTLNPAYALRHPAGRCNPHPPLNPTQLRQLYTHVFTTTPRSHYRTIVQRDRTIIALLAEHGLRPCQITRANIGHVHSGGPGRPAQLAVSSAKGGAANLIELTERADHCLSAYLRLRGRARRTEPLLLTVKGNRLTSHTIGQITAQAARRAGLGHIELTPYTLRRTFAYRVWKRNHDLEEVRRALLQTTLSATIHYLGQITPITAGADLARTDDPLRKTEH